MTNSTELVPTPSDPAAPFTDRLRLAVAAYLAASRAPLASACHHEALAATANGNVSSKNQFRLPMESNMPKPADDGFDNVRPLPLADRAYGELPVTLEEVKDAVRSFDQLERCSAKLQRGPLGIAGRIDTTEQPIVSLQLQLPAIQQWLEMLEVFGVANCSDARWVIGLTDARAVAVARLRAVRKGLRNFLPGMGSLDIRLVADVRELADALYVLRQLIVQRWPTLPGHERNTGHRDIRH